MPSEKKEVKPLYDPSAPAGFEPDDPANADLIRRVTTIVRDADMEFEKAGGSSRHWVRDHFLPLLDAAGLRVTEKAAP